MNRILDGPVATLRTAEMFGDESLLIVFFERHSFGRLKMFPHPFHLLMVVLSGYTEWVENSFVESCRITR